MTDILQAITQCQAMPDRAAPASQTPECQATPDRQHYQQSFTRFAQSL